MTRWMLLAATLLATPAHAVNFGTPDKPDLAVLQTQIDNGDASAAEKALRAALDDAPGDADILNLLGYANRKLNRWTEARALYTRALAADPRHRGALEYMGELELETGRVDAARALLGRLQEACPQGCEELNDLIEAFAAHGIGTTAEGS